MVLIQLDVKIAFLNVDLENPALMTIPQGSKINPNLRVTHVLQLFRSLYGLRVTPKRWYGKIRKTMSKLGLKLFILKPCIYKWEFVKAGVTEQVLFVTYVHGILLVGDCPKKLQEVVSKFRTEFEVTDLGTPQKFIGIEFQYDRPQRNLFLHQTSFISKMLQSFGVTEHAFLHSTLFVTLDSPRKRKSVPELFASPTKYRVAVGSLLHLMNALRPNIAFPVNKVSRAQAALTTSD